MKYRFTFRSFVIACSFLLLLVSMSGCFIFSAGHHKGGYKKDGYDPKITKTDPVSERLIENSSAKRFIGHLTWPVTGAKISSLFGHRGGSFHEGVDIPAPEGTKIHAAHSGKVVYRNNQIHGYGNLIIIQTHDLLTVYGHLSEYDVTLGQEVEEGEIIAFVGATGDATGPHLHFETRIKDKAAKNAAIDPLVFYSRVTGG